MVGGVRLAIATDLRMQGRKYQLSIFRNGKMSSLLLLLPAYWRLKDYPEGSCLTCHIQGKGVIFSYSYSPFSRPAECVGLELFGFFFFCVLFSH